MPSRHPASLRCNRLTDLPDHPGFRRILSYFLWCSYCGFLPNTSSFIPRLRGIFLQAASASAICHTCGTGQDTALQVKRERCFPPGRQPANPFVKTSNTSSVWAAHQHTEEHVCLMPFFSRALKHEKAAQHPGRRLEEIVRVLTSSGHRDRRREQDLHQVPHTGEVVQVKVQVRSFVR